MSWFGKIQGKSDNVLRLAQFHTGIKQEFLKNLSLLLQYLIRVVIEWARLIPILKFKVNSC